MRLPAADTDRRAAHSSVGRHSPFDGSSVDKRLKARTGLPVSLGCIIELAGTVEIVTTNHGDDLACLGVERHNRPGHRRHLRQFNFQAPALLVNFFDLKLR